MRFAYLIAMVFGLAALIWAGVRGSRFDLTPWEIFPDMDLQYKVRFQKPSDFFADGVAARMPVAGTVPMGYSVPSKPVAAGGKPDPYAFRQADDYFNTGAMGDVFGDGMPEEITANAVFLARGKERFEIFCSVCHGSSGNGRGVVANYWPSPIANLHEERFVNRATTPDGAIFHTISYGKGLMGPYGGNITVRDRWAIVAYLRALQVTKAGAGTIAAPAGETTPPPAPADADAPAPVNDPETPSSASTDGAS